MSSTARSRCWARTPITCRAGTATACPSSGRSRSSIATRARTRIPCPSSSSARNAAISPAIGSAIQSEEFRRLGVEGDWAHPYTTMTFAAEAQILREIGKFLMNGGLFRGSKPVLWSVVEKTALAEAEVEYHDHVSNTIYVAFPVRTSARSDLRRRLGGDLDDDALDHPGQPRHRLWRGDRLCPAPGRRGGGGQQGRARRQADPGQGTARGLRRGDRHHGIQHRSGPGRAARLAGIVCHHPLGRPGLRLPCAAAAGRLRHHRAGHGPRPYRAGPWRRRLGGCPRPWRRGAADGGWRRPLLRSCAAVSPASGC